MKRIKHFVADRLRSVNYASKGFFILLRTENAVITHTLFFLGFSVLGAYLGLTQTQWLIQLLGFGLLFATEGLNTAIEKLCDFIHPDFHSKIGEIKDVSAGAVTFAWVFLLAILAVLYAPVFWRIIFA